MPGLREFRERRKLPAEALAMLVGTHKSSISRWERGLVKPRPAQVVRLAQVLGVSANRMATMIAEGCRDEQPR